MQLTARSSHAECQPLQKPGAGSQGVHTGATPGAPPERRFPGCGPHGAGRSSQRGCGSTRRSACADMRQRTGCHNRIRAYASASSCTPYGSSRLQC